MDEKKATPSIVVNQAGSKPMAIVHQRSRPPDFPLSLPVYAVPNSLSISPPNPASSHSPQAHSLDKRQTLYKTEICRAYEETGLCRYGDRCQFAHSQEERRLVPRHPRYKTEICKTFWDSGTCPYGRRCCFIHHDGEKEMTSLSGSLEKEEHCSMDIGALESKRESRVLSRLASRRTSISQSQSLSQAADSELSDIFWLSRSFQEQSFFPPNSTQNQKIAKMESLDPIPELEDLAMDVLRLIDL